MKQILLILVLLLSVGMAVSQTPSPTPPTTAQPSAEDIKQAKENIRVLLGEQKPTPEQGKNVADVMDKGLDMLSGYVGTLEGVVSKFAPEVWRIMVKQQYAKAISYPVFWGLLILLPIGFHWMGRKSVGAKKGQPLYEADTDSDGFLYGLFCILPSVAGMVCGAFFIYYLSQSIMIAVNPEYYALKDIIDLLR